MADAPVKTKDDTTKVVKDDKPLINAVQDGATARSIGKVEPPPTDENLGKAWDRAVGSDPKGQATAFGAIDNKIVERATAALTGAADKKAAITGLEQGINGHVSVDGGPTLSLSENGKQLTIAHMRVASDAEAKKLDAMSPADREKANAYKVGVGSNGDNSSEKWVVPVLPAKTYDVSDKTIAGGAPKADGAPTTKEPYSADVSRVAFDALAKRTGLNLADASKWDAKTPEQQWWTKAMQDANPADLPPGVQVKAMAAVGKGGADIVNKAVGTDLQDSGRPDSMYLAGSLASSVDWSGKAKSMEIKDAQGNVVKNPNRPDGMVDSVYKQGKVYDVGGTKVLELYDDKTKGKMYAVADPGNLPAGMDYTKYAQSMVDKALKTEGKPGPIEFPAYEKSVDQKLDGIIGMGVKGTDFFIAQAKMKAVWAGNKDGEFSIEKQSFEMRTRSIQIRPEDPPATRIDSPGMILMKTNDKGHVWTSARMNVADGDFKVPDIEKLKKENGYN